MRITGTHIYSLLHCPHRVALDLHEDRDKRRPVTELEEFVRKRGRDWEDEFVKDLGYEEPEFERGDYAAGAAQTEAFLRAGVIGVTQAVLLGDAGRLGIPDLLRKEPGASAFGDFHYVVGDIKSSGRPRSDQVLQVAFYSRMLAQLQEREPEYGYLILKDGREERFTLAEFAAAIEEVEERVFEFAADRSVSEPFYSRECHKCHWSELCIPELEAADDLSLLDGMTRGVRTTLRRHGYETCASLREMLVESASKATHLESALLRRLKKGALARAEGAPVRQEPSAQGDLRAAAIVHHLYDAFSERLLYIGVQYPARPDGEVFAACPQSRDAELPAFEELIGRLPRRVPLLHYGSWLARWYSEATADGAAGGATATEARFVDLSRRVRGAAVYPGPVFGVADHVQYALGVDPHREGEADAAAMWAGKPEGEAWLRNKGTADLRDLCALVEEVLVHAAPELDGGRN